MANEEFILKLSMMQQQAEKLEEQIQLINQQIQELGDLRLNLDKIKEGEILANLGKGIFVRSEIKEKKLFVNIGEKIIVRKTAEETQELIQKQILRLEEIKSQLLGEIQEVNLNLQNLIQEVKAEEKIN